MGGSTNSGRRVAAGRPAAYRLSAMRYISTRDGRPEPATYAFEDVLLAGLAEDGGLFVPAALPAFDAAGLRDLAGLPYAELAARVIARFAGGSFAVAELHHLTERAFGTFRPAPSAPLF